MKDNILIFGGSGSPKLTLKICEYLRVKAGAGEVLRFSDGNLFVRVKENVRGRRVYLVQSTVFPTNDNFMEMLFWIDALKRASAESVTVVMPYFSYAKGDKKGALMEFRTELQNNLTMDPNVRSRIAEIEAQQGDP